MIDCPAHIENNKWAKIKAGTAGWFFTKDDKAYCPDHIPYWVTNWRNRGK